jgi:hypothetical protein
MNIGLGKMSSLENLTEDNIKENMSYVLKRYPDAKIVKKELDINKSKVTWFEVIWSGRNQFNQRSCGWIDERTAWASTAIEISILEARAGVKNKNFFVEIKKFLSQIFLYFKIQISNFFLRNRSQYEQP